MDSLVVAVTVACTGALGFGKPTSSGQNAVLPRDLGECDVDGVFALEHREAVASVTVLRSQQDRPPRSISSLNSGSRIRRARSCWAALARTPCPRSPPRWAEGP